MKTHYKIILGLIPVIGLICGGIFYSINEFAQEKTGTSEKKDVLEEEWQKLQSDDNGVTTLRPISKLNSSSFSVTTLDTKSSGEKTLKTTIQPKITRKYATFFMKEWHYSQSIFPREPFTEREIQESVFLLRRLWHPTSIDMSKFTQLQNGVYHLPPKINNSPQSDSLNFLADLLLKHTWSQRDKINKKYIQFYEKDIRDEFKFYDSNFFGLLLGKPNQDAVNVNRLLLTDPLDIQVADLDNALSFFKWYRPFEGILTDVIIDILFTKSNHELGEFTRWFNKGKEKSLQLENRCMTRTSTGFKKILSKVLKAQRSHTTFYDKKVVSTYAEQLHNAFVKGHREQVYDMFTELSLPQLKLISESYVFHYNKNLLDVIEKNYFEGWWWKSERLALRAIYHMAHYPTEYWAKRIREATDGLGTDDRSLSRILVLRSEIDMRRIRYNVKYTFKYDSLRTTIEGDTSKGGTYQNQLLVLSAYDLSKPRDIGINSDSYSNSTEQRFKD